MYLYAEKFIGGYHDYSDEEKAKFNSVNDLAGL